MIQGIMESRRVGFKTRESGEMESYYEIIINEIMSE